MSHQSQHESLAPLTVHDGVHTIMLNRPARHNALIPELLTDVRSSIAQAREDGAACLVLQAAGRSFSTGGDVAEFAARSGPELEEYARVIVGELNEVIMDLIALKTPVVAAVHGPVTGGSLGLVLAADIAVGAPSAWFQSFYNDVGFSPDGGWTALLPRQVGRARASAWLLNNVRISSQTAHEVGLLTHIDENPATLAHELARDIVSRPPGSIGRTKALLGPDLRDVRAGLDRELEQFVDQILTEEAHRGMAAFLGGAPRGDVN